MDRQTMIKDQPYMWILPFSHFLTLFILASHPRPSAGISVQNRSICGMFLKKNWLGPVAIILEDISGLSFCLWNHILKGVDVPRYTHQMIKCKSILGTVYVRYINILSSNYINSVPWGNETDLQDCPCKIKFLINEVDNPVHNSEVDTTSKGIPSCLSFCLCVP